MFNSMIIGQEKIHLLHSLVSSPAQYSDIKNLRFCDWLPGDSDA